MKETIVQYKKPLTALVFIGALILAYIFRDKWLAWFKPNATLDTTNQDQPNNNNNNTSNSNPPPSNTPLNKDLVLSKGSNNQEVRELQRLMNEHHQYLTNQGVLPPPMPLLVVDGAFGAKTEAMLSFMMGKNSASIKQFTAFVQAQKDAATSIYQYTWD